MLGLIPAFTFLTKIPFTLGMYEFSLDCKFSDLECL